MFKLNITGIVWTRRTENVGQKADWWNLKRVVLPLKTMLRDVSLPASPHSASACTLYIVQLNIQTQLQLQMQIRKAMHCNASGGQPALPCLILLCFSLLLKVIPCNQRQIQGIFILCSNSLHHIMSLCWTFFWKLQIWIFPVCILCEPTKLANCGTWLVSANLWSDKVYSVIEWLQTCLCSSIV